MKNDIFCCKCSQKLEYVWAELKTGRTCMACTDIESIKARKTRTGNSTLTEYEIQEGQAQ